MKRTLIILALVFILALTVSAITAFAQSAPAQRQPANDKQWMSHQMYQPPPETSVRYRLSQRAVDEIAQLYELAMKESEGKATTSK